MEGMEGMMDENQERMLHIIAYLCIQINVISDELNKQGVDDEAINGWLDAKYPSMKNAWKSLFEGAVVG